MLTRALIHVRLLIIGFAMLSLAPVTSLAGSGPRATEFTLPNGLMVVVVPDNRAPVVTHMIW
jgi:zinc protease